MVATGKAFLFGFLIWLSAFVIAFLIFPIRESWRALFESIMPVVVTLATAGFAVLYFRRVNGAYVKEGIILGSLWFAMNVVIDLPLMLSGPIGMSLTEYAADIGLTYLIIPIVTVGIGLTCAQAFERARARADA